MGNPQYIIVRLDRDSPFYSMANYNGYTPEHRLVMAQFIGRPLLRTEVVHHINGDRKDNRLENLLLLPNSKAHMLLHLSLRLPNHKSQKPFIRINMRAEMKEELTQRAQARGEEVATYCRQVLMRHLQVPLKLSHRDVPRGHKS